MQPDTSCSIRKEFVSCDLCGSDDQELLYSIVDHTSGDEYHLVACTCGMGFVNPMPYEDEIPRLYPTQYLKDKDDQTGLYSKMIQYLPSTPGKLLDIGCGRGDFIHETRTKGWAAEGVDLIDWGNPHAVPIHVGDYSEMKLPEGTYDVATAWSSLEHVRKPSLFFRQSSLLLKPGGFFISIVPNFMAPGMRYCCTQDVPRHLWLFSPIAIHRYAEKFGFIVSKIYHDDSIYSCYPFGMVRYHLSRTNSRKCHDYENRAVAMLQHVSFRDNYSNWIKDVLKTLPLKDIFIDAIDLGIGIVLAKVSKYLRNYGMITVVLRKL